MSLAVPLRGELLHNEPLSRHTTWRVGGPARWFYRPADVADAAHYVASRPASEPLLWLGLGSNVLVRDGGFSGSVIVTHGGVQGLSLGEERTVRVEAGVPSAKAARFCAQHGLGGIEFLAGIPGTIGGALAMNAGAWGGEIWQYVSRVETLDRSGQIRCRYPEEFSIAYREVGGLAVDEWFTVAYLRLESVTTAESLAKIRALLALRNRSQPTRVASCGSVFRNPPGDYAARLIDSSGLKGYRIGGAQVSEQHANFIINTGTATAADLENLLAYVAAQVEGQHGVRLRPEVRIVGDLGQDQIPVSLIHADAE